ncbi:MAG: ABC transporter ATP-binding protein [Solirubrobacteraceae bacterium]
MVAHELTRRYGEGDIAVQALAGVSVEFSPARFAAIMGPSGSGKSTLMHILAGLDRPTSGSVTLDGIDLGALDDKALTLLRREKVGFIFQSFNLLPFLDARRVAVARALVSRPAVVFADEPTGNLDSAASGEVLELLRRAVDDLGQTVVMVTHDAHAAAHSDRLIVLADGRIVRDGAALDGDGILDLMKSLS